jgi:hypothetical protein
VKRTRPHKIIWVFLKLCDFHEKMVGFLIKNLGNQRKPQTPPVISWNELPGRVRSGRRSYPAFTGFFRKWPGSRVSGTRPGTQNTLRNNCLRHIQLLHSHSRSHSPLKISQTKTHQRTTKLLRTIYCDHDILQEFE